MGYYETTEETRSTIARLKREKRHDEAMALCETWMADPWRPNGEVESEPFRHAAILHRQAKRYSDEVVVLERFAQLTSSGSKQSADLLYDRLPKAYMLAGIAENRTVDGQKVIYHIESNRPVDEMPMFVKTVLLVDTETTGLSGDDELIEIACILFQVSAMSGRVFQIVDQYEALREPGCPISKPATKVHGLTIDDVRGEKIDEDRICGMLAAADLVVAHNASFDRRFLASLMPQFADATWYCTMNGIRWKSKGFESKALDFLVNQLKIDRSRGHRAMDDAHATLTLLRMCDAETGEPYVQELLVNSPVGFTSRYEQQANVAPQDTKETGSRIIGAFRRLFG